MPLTHRLKTQFALLKTFRVLLFYSLYIFFCANAYSGTLYLPLHQSPEVEARVERLFVLADMPVIKRPISINHVLKALDKIEGQDPLLSQSLRFYLARYEASIGITHATAAIASGGGDQAHSLANQRGLTTDDKWFGSFAGFWALNDYIAINAGARFRQSASGSDKVIPEGSFISIGWDYFQADIGYRAHWLGPFQHSDMLFTTNARSLPGITFSNSEPFDFLNMHYEVGIMRMSRSDRIESAQDPSEDLEGFPKLLSTHFSLEPFDGFAIGFNRLIQFGGADRDDSPKSILKAFLNAKRNDNVGNRGLDFGNQLTSVNTRFTFEKTIPIAVYMEFAGEDTSQPSDFHLGNSSLMFGLHLPKLPYHLDVTLETAQWQNAWYVNGNYGDGLTNYGDVIGHWATNFRDRGDSRGLSAHLVQVLWDDYGGTSFKTTLRTVSSEPAQNDKSNGHEVSFEISHAYKSSIVGLTLSSGKNIDGEDYSYAAGFIRW